MNLRICSTMHRQQRKDLGKPVTSKIHLKRFAEHLVTMAPEELKVEGEGPGRGHMTCIAHKRTVGEALKSDYEQNRQDACNIVKAALNIRDRIIASSQIPFNGHFGTDCLQSTIPETLLTFMKLELQGPACLGAGSEGINKQRSNVACTLSHLIMFNTVKREVPGKTVMRHNKTREMSFPLYVGLKINTDAKLKHLIINFEKLGLCISYKREREINRAFAIGVSERIKQEGIVVPTNMRRNVFTTTDLDNTDQHKRSNLSKEEFHGALITITNHLSYNNQGEPREPINFDDTDLSSKPELPASYSVVPPAQPDAKADVLLSRSEHPVRPSHDKIACAFVKDEAWITEAAILITHNELKPGDVVTWAGFNSTLQSDDNVKPRANIGILPLFPDKAASVAMVKHSLLLGKSLTDYLNPGQTPVQDCSRRRQQSVCSPPPLWIWKGVQRKL